MNVSQAIALVPPGARIFVQGGAATPNFLLRELVAQRERLGEATLIHLHTEGEALYARPEHREYFRVINLFVGHNVRKYLDFDRVDYLPCFLSEIPALFRTRKLPLDVAFLHVSPPDRLGYVSLGVSVDVAKAAADAAQILIAQVNRRMPRVQGDGLFHSRNFAAMVDINEPLPEPPVSAPSRVELAIAKHVSGLVEDGSTLQMGIGAIPNAVARDLVGHRKLGLHTEMWSDGVLELIQCGALTNEKKKVHRGKSVSSFLMGSRKLYDFVHDNPTVLQLEADYVNNPTNIARNPKVVAINSAVEIDLTGQVCADSIGARVISGVGGQMDFIRGAALSRGGKPIIALPSTTKDGQSKIVVALRPQAGVVSTRAHVHYVVTEYGVASLYGKTLGERARALIEIAHPDHRENLARYPLTSGQETGQR